MKKDTHVAFRMNLDDFEEIKRIAKRLEIPQSQLIRNLVRSGIDDLRFAESLGLVSLIGFLRKQEVDPEEIFNFVAEKRLEASK